MRWSWLIVVMAGCVTPPFGLGKKTEAPRGPIDSMVLGATDADRNGPDAPTYAELDDATRLFKENEFGKAQPIFAKLANNTKNPVPIAAEARYFEAECQRQTNDYRSASATYKRLIKDFPHCQYTDQANRRLFDIASYWLEDTRVQMAAYDQKREGKRWFIMPASFVNFSRDKPMFDVEGHAVQCLEDVRLNDINGPLGEKALFYLATVKYFRADYREADYYYTQLYQTFPNSPLAPKALKQAIVCKQISTGGSVYDTRTLEEARKLIDVANRAYPQLASKETEWLERQVISINMQQADRDWNIAEFYRRTGKSGSAYFYYELVRRRYPGTSYAERAEQRLTEVRGKAEREHNAEQTAEQTDTRTGRSRGLLGYLMPPRQQPPRREDEPAPAPRSMPPIQGQPLQ